MTHAHAKLARLEQRADDAAINRRRFVGFGTILSTWKQRDVYVNRGSMLAWKCAI